METYCCSFPPASLCSFIVFYKQCALNLILPPPSPQKNKFSQKKCTSRSCYAMRLNRIWFSVFVVAIRYKYHNNWSYLKPLLILFFGLSGFIALYDKQTVFRRVATSFFSFRSNFFFVEFTG